MNGEQRIAITEYLDVDLASEQWTCRRCDAALGDAADDYKRHLLIHDRDPREVHPARFATEHSYAPDPAWCRIVEFYCPSCGTQVETEYLPPGHPLTRDIEIDLASLRRIAAERAGERAEEAR
ncbi:acetone carboxylase subunit gamma [Conexibacter arvalis]|uniref:Acetophenone carboxylase n=1 Tax=Conexibacter arvalis TaxID=912552 RepID=A0A840I945_9ACTN|nr:acetone carboxylase subunit gamma [Conexibacter arvalis]MBB4660628.1 acetophenone carboxylase [Conexibacter arvalis]